MSSIANNTEPKTFIKNKYEINDEELDNIINTDINELEDANKLIKKDYEKTVGLVEHNKLMNSFNELDIPRPKSNDRRTFENRQKNN